MLTQFSTTGLSLFSAIVLSRLLPPSTFGMIAMATFFRGIMQVFTATGFIESAVQKKNLCLNDINGLFWMNVIVSFILATIFAACGPMIAEFYGQSVLTNICLVFALLFLLENLFLAHNAILRRAMLVEISFIIVVLSPTVGIVLSIIMAYTGFGIWALVAAPVFSAVTSRFFFLYFVRWSPGGVERSSEFWGMFRYGIGASAGTIVNYLTNYSQNMALGKFASAADVGFFSRGQTLFMMPTTKLVAPISGLILPALSSMQEDRGKLLDLILRAQWLIVLGIMPFTLFVVIYGDWLVPFLLGNQWAVSGQVAQWLAVASVPILMNNMLGRGNAAIGRPGRGVPIGIVFLPILLTGIFFAAPHGAVLVANVFALVKWTYSLITVPWHLKGSGMDRRRYVRSLACLLLLVGSSAMLLCLSRSFFPEEGIIGQFFMAVFVGALSFIAFFFSFRYFHDGSAVMQWLYLRFGQVIRLPRAFFIQTNMTVQN